MVAAKFHSPSIYQFYTLHVWCEDKALPPKWDLSAMGKLNITRHDKPSAKEASSRLTKVGSAFLENQSILKRFISRFIYNPHDIEDIVHEAFLRTYDAEIKTQIQSPKAFLFRTARNLAVKHLTKSSYRLTDYLADFDISEVITDELSTESVVEAQEQFAIFCKAVSRLPLQCRRAFILRKVYGLSHKEIAERLNLSVSTVEKHLATGISRCSDYMRSRNSLSSLNRSSSKTNFGQRTDGKSVDE